MPILLDTCIYIEMFRGNPSSTPGWLRSGQDTELWLSAVVLEELYAGARAVDYPHLAGLAAAFAVDGRILVPELEDWTQAGLALNFVGRRHGFEQVKRSRMTNDALIAMSCARAGIAILTANGSDYAKLAEFRPFAWRQPATMTA